MHLALYDVGTCVWSCPCKDVSPTGLKISGKPASCPELAGSCTCKDASSTGIDLGGKPASCTQLKRFCTHSSYGPAVRQKCPLTCSICDTKTSKLVREKCPATCNSWPTEIEAEHLNCTGTKRYMPSDFSPCSHATKMYAKCSRGKPAFSFKQMSAQVYASQFLDGNNPATDFTTEQPH